MAKRKAPPAREAFPRQLQIAEEFSARLGKRAKRLSLTVGGENRPGLIVWHGSLQVVVLTIADGVLVLVDLQIPPDERARLQAYTAPTQEEMLFTLKSAMLQRQRTGYGVYPPEAKSVGELERVRVEQQVVLSRTDIGTLNRFEDAVQEVVQAASVAGMLLSLGDPAAKDIYTASDDEVPGYA